MHPSHHRFAKKKIFAVQQAGGRLFRAWLLPLLVLTAAFGLHCGVDPASLPALSTQTASSPAAIPAALRATYLQARQSEDAADHTFLSALWTPQEVLTAWDGATGDAFGAVVAIDGETAVIGAPYKQVGTHARQGQVYVFVRSGTNWTLQAILVDSLTGTAADNFGNSVAVSGDTIVVGANLKNVGAIRQQGQAYIFVRSGTMWTQQAILVDTVTGASGDQFGITAAVQGDTAVIGCPHSLGPGKVYVFVRSGTAWIQQAVLENSTPGAVDRRFAYSLALDRDTVVTGAYESTVGTKFKQGRAYVFVRSGTAWSQQATLEDVMSGAADDQFGIAVAVSGDTVLVGAYNKDVGAHRQQGQTYVFVRAGITWTQQAILTDVSTGAAGDFFGYSVALHGNTAAIGAVIKVVGPIDRQGQAYIFGRIGTTWSQHAILVDEVSGATDDRFGYTIGLSGDTALVGAVNERAYVFTLTPGPNGTACESGSDCSSTYCVDGLCCNSACGGGVSADCQSCRGAETGDPDGTCSTIAWAASHTCRAAAGICDLPEYCDGTSDRCPADARYQAADRLLCRAATFCSRDTYCDGSTVYCPPTLCMTPDFEVGRPAAVRIQGNRENAFTSIP